MTTVTREMTCIEKNFYVDNWLQSFSSPDVVTEVVDKLRSLLSEGGFELRQWASSTPDLISNLPKEIRSESSVQWLNQTDMGPQKPALGLRWMCCSDTLHYNAVGEESSYHEKHLPGSGESV